MALRFPAGGVLGPDALAVGPGLATHLVPFTIWAVATFHHAASLLIAPPVLPPNTGQLALNAVLVGVLAVALGSWTLLRVRGRVSAASGAGLVLAAYSLAMRAWCELGAAYTGHALDRDEGTPLLELTLFGGRWLALAGFAVGLACAIAAVVVERRLARRALTWVARA